MMGIVLSVCLSVCLSCIFLPASSVSSVSPYPSGSVPQFPAGSSSLCRPCGPRADDLSLSGLCLDEPTSTFPRVRSRCALRVRSFPWILAPRLRWGGSFP
ncbi:hypothetical protein BO71DRAFT_51773 [Aspergillus ellipticus CBS 707.79]|uniref:Secreted protein n=1 Tax=Aspergillus ellipticus CBS 707.79 TaxID=1448320 RepID=A0A319D290_9EURO|nr:hypothetical protein BO71DRAFT_51773 [Aspergillus ellipticus CBS 707.79]